MLYHELLQVEVLMTSEMSALHGTWSQFAHERSAQDLLTDATPRTLMSGMLGRPDSQSPIELT